MEIALQEDIKWWVFLPILVGLVLFSKLKNNLQQLFGAATPKTDAVKTEAALKDKSFK